MILNHKRILPVSQIVYLSSPNASIIELIFLTLSAEIIFIIDDLVDDYDVNPKNFIKLLNGQNYKKSPLLEESEKYFNFYFKLASHFCLTDIGLSKKYILRFTKNIIAEQDLDYADENNYLKIRVNTSGIRFYSNMLKSINDDKFDDKEFKEFCYIGGYAVRLANDIETYHKERFFLDNNFIKFEMSKGVNESEAFSNIKDRLNLMHAKFKKFSGRSSIPINYFNFVDFIIRMYMVTDFDKPKMTIINNFLQKYSTLPS